MTNTQDNTVPSDCDVIVIGGGVAGLTSSALLSKSGLRVVLLEEQPRPGGYLTSFRRKGYTFDSSVQWLNQCGEGKLIDRLFRHIGTDYPACHTMKRIHRYKSDSADYVLTSDPDQLRDQLVLDYPEDERGILRFFADCKRIGLHFGKLDTRMRAIETMSFPERTRFGLKMALWTVPIMKYLRMTAEKGVRNYFQSDGMKKLFQSEDRFMSVIMPICWAYSGDFQSAPYGGTGTMTDWLWKKLTDSSSSRVVVNRGVEKILLSGKTATGVVLSDGRTITGKYIIAACDLQHLYEKMLPQGAVPEDVVRRIRKTDLYHSAVTVFLGLDCDVSSLGLHEEVTCIVQGGVVRADCSGSDPDKITLIVQAPSVRDPSLAPQGKSTVIIHCAACMEYEARWKTEKDFGRGQAYRALKEHYAAILIARVEKAMGMHLKKHIEVVEVATPVTYWRYTGNRGGSMMGQKPTLRNIFTRVAHYRTPVENIFVGGHWAEYGGGVPIAVKAASNASLLVLKEMNKKEFVKLRDIMDGKDKGDR